MPRNVEVGQRFWTFLFLAALEITLEGGLVKATSGIDDGNEPKAGAKPLVRSEKGFLLG